MVKLNYIVSHPIYYQINLLNHLNAQKNIELNVFFYKKFNINQNNYDAEFKKKINLDKFLRLNFNFFFLNSIANNIKLIKLIFEKNSKSIFWFHGWNSLKVLFLIILIKIFSKKKIYIRAENFYKDSYFKHKFKSFFYKIFDSFLYIGKGNYNYFKNFGVSERKLIPLYYSSGIFNKDLKLNKKINYNNKKIKLIFVGKLIKRKNIIFLVNSLNKFNKNNSKKIYLDIYGDGPLRNELLGLIDNKNSKKYIVYKGFASNNFLRKIYKKYSFLILPSIHENWGLVVNEAMESGLGVLLGKNVGSQYDLLRDGKNGFSFDYNETSIMSILQIITSLKKNEINNFGKVSYQIIKSFTIENISKNFIENLSSI